MKKKEEYELFLQECESILKDPRFLQENNFIQHGQITTLEHSVAVAWLAWRLNKHLHLHADEEDLKAACLLHDYYLYDWHDCGDHLHGLHHPYIAAENACRDFAISDTAQKAIMSHMWPLNPLQLPSSKVAWLLTMSDKACSTRETLFCRKKRHER